MTPLSYQGGRGPSDWGDHAKGRSSSPQRQNVKERITRSLEGCSNGAKIGRSSKQKRRGRRHWGKEILSIKSERVKYRASESFRENLLELRQDFRGKTKPGVKLRRCVCVFSTLRPVGARVGHFNAYGGLRGTLE